MHPCAVGDTLVLKVEHLLPDAITVLCFGLIEGFLFEDASLHLVEELLLGQWTGQMAIMLIILLPFLEGGMTFAGEEVDLFLEELVIEIVVFDLLEEAYE